MVEDMVKDKVENTVVNFLMEEISQLDRPLIIYRMVMPSGVHAPLLTIILVDKLKLNADKVGEFNLSTKSMLGQWYHLKCIL